MIEEKFPLSPKYKDFIATQNARVEILEGTTLAGKTTVGLGLKIPSLIAKSHRKFHVISALTVGLVQQNLLQKENSVLDIWQDMVYCGSGDKDINTPHIKWKGKIIILCGYKTRDMWQKIRGKQLGIVYIDEANLASIDFVQECLIRSEYCMMTLNPDNPDKDIYKYINQCRPYKKYADCVPKQIMEYLNATPSKDGWKYWFFDFYDNASLSEEVIQRRKSTLTEGTQQYKSLILGLRGKATGVIFAGFGGKNIITKEELHKMVDDGTVVIKTISCGVDTAYSNKSEDTIAFTYTIITTDRRMFLVDVETLNNKGRQVSLAPSDIIARLNDFLDRNEQEWGFARNVFIDSADQATITEANKYKRLYGSLHNFASAWKKTKIIDRIKLMDGWIQDGSYMVCDNCKEHIRELGVYCWDEEKDNVPEDANDHTINSCQYAWLPYKHEIGNVN